MYHLTSTLKKYNIYATDGEMGKVHDLYFDDSKWGLRYAVVDSRKWLPGRRVLLSPATFDSINIEEEFVKANEDKETIRNSPNVPEGQPITKEVEKSLTGYYGWGRYWTDSMVGGVQPRPYNDVRNEALAKDQLQQELNLNEEKHHDLRSADETMDYKVHADDGKLGHAADFVLDDHYWRMRYMVVKGEGLQNEGNYYVIDLQDIESVDWFEGDIYVKGSLDSFKQKKHYQYKEDILADL
ncbi:PRC-barrel domain-containing protein [Virgibacillus ihumii]|uniref:PRC-barrel domain-containing protein n=1 Tax=Virgibacillus ihumii TaxID=2686091 RepID=UPI00157BDC7B|nr:PRC-barrel domain-containing protein [Virgibacillus ihumii]